MSWLDIRKALETALNNINPALATQWENEPYTPVVDTPYQRVHLLPAEPENPEMNGTLIRELGLLQIDLCYPLFGGPKAAADRAQLLRVAFEQGTAMVSGGVTVIVEKSPWIAPAIYEPDRYVLPVRVPYFSNVIGP